MASDRKSRYDSFDIYVPDDLTQEFITGFGAFGLHVGKVRCFSANLPPSKNFSTLFMNVVSHTLHLS
jgi:hypothetical protein